MTNADKIRAMSTEELCNFIVYQVCPEEHDRDYCHSTRCKQCWLQWLNKEEKI